MSKPTTLGTIRVHTNKYFEYRKNHFANQTLVAKSLNDSAEKNLSGKRYIFL